ncbi:hypothetical protein DSO57_1029752 [Entomophthora muscae]|uniref:Uncharacterized protein n=1 Tax=Entomophthora muscae TaxID=34485 RepID=A0ACC2UAV3_9FUNG|nr:hypothetical protein DSO57_1029752 [Entomophthora muscae]
MAQGVKETIWICQYLESPNNILDSFYLVLDSFPLVLDLCSLDLDSCTSNLDSGVALRIQLLILGLLLPPVALLLHLYNYNQALAGDQKASKNLSAETQKAVERPYQRPRKTLIDNSPPLEPQAQEQELNPEPGSPGPPGLWTAHPHFSGVKPPQADAEDDGPSSETDQAKEIIAPNGVPITTPNGGAKVTTISFMSLKSTPATNQEPTQGKGTGLQPSPMTTTLE